MDENDFNNSAKIRIEITAHRKAIQAGFLMIFGENIKIMMKEENAIYSENLKRALRNEGMTVGELARVSGIPKSTLYSMIRRGSALRYDTAIRVAEILHISVSSISKSPMAGNEPDFPGNSVQHGNKIPEGILLLFEHSDQEDIERLLLAYYQLTGHARKTAITVIEDLCKNPSMVDPDRKTALSKIGFEDQP